MMYVRTDTMAALRAAKQALRKEIKRRVAAVTDQEKHRQSLVVSHKVRDSYDTQVTTYCTCARNCFPIQYMILINVKRRSLMTRCFIELSSCCEARGCH